MRPHSLKAAPRHPLLVHTPEEQRLPGPRQCTHNLLDLRLKAHVEHAVGLIQHQVRDLAEADLAGLQKVVQAAGRRDDDGDAVVEVAQLRAFGRAAVHAAAHACVSSGKGERPGVEQLGGG
eukprot:361603-Chlamydomonas_euryale.AAC.10